MTVTNTTITAGPYLGNGLADTFSYAFGIQDKSEIRVFETTDSGVETELILDTDYTVNGVGDEAGGTVTRNAGALPSNYQWYMRSDYPETQETSFESQGAFYPDIHERGFDKPTRLIQQLRDLLNRTLKVSDSYTGDYDLTIPNPSEKDLLRFTDDGIEGLTIGEILSESDAIISDLSIQNNRIINLGQGSSPSDAARLSDIDNVPVTTGEYQTFNTIFLAKAADLPIGDVIDTIGYTTVNDGAGGKYRVVNSVPGRDDGGSYHDMTNGNQLELIVESNTVDIKQFGAIGDDSTLNSVFINNAISFIHSIGGGCVIVPVGTFLCENSGTLSAVRFCIEMKSNVLLKGFGNVSILKQAPNQDSSVLVDDNTVQTVNMSINDLLVDGNESNQTTGASALFNIWINNSDRLYLDNVFSKDPGSFGYRLQLCSNLSFGTIQSLHTTSETTADGFHLIDCTDVVGDKVLVNTNGDDGFVIEANDQDVHDISIGEVVVTAPVTSTAAGKGIYLVNNAANGSAGIQREIRNISIANAVTHNCKGTGCILERAEFRNIEINHTGYSDGVGAGFIIGDSSGTGVTGLVESCRFSFKNYNAQTTGLQTTVVDGTITGNIIDLQIYNPADGQVGGEIKGDEWIGNIQVNYNPNNDKVTQLQPIRITTNDSQFNVVTKGGNSGIRLNGSNNTITPVSIKDFTTRDIEVVSGSDSNSFSGGLLTTSVSDSGTNTTFYNVFGATNEGVVQDTTEASGGILNIPHGLIKSPTVYNAGIVGDNSFDAQIQSVNSTNVVVRVRNTTDNSDVNSTSVVVYWKASI